MDISTRLILGQSLGHTVRGLLFYLIFCTAFTGLGIAQTGTGPTLAPEAVEAIAFLEALKTVDDPYDLPQLPSEDGWYEYLLDFSTMFDGDRNRDPLVEAGKKNSIPALITLLDVLQVQIIPEWKEKGDKANLSEAIALVEKYTEQLMPLSLEQGIIFDALHSANKGNCQTIEYQNVLASAEKLQDPTFSTLTFVIAKICDGELNFQFPKKVYSFAPFRPAYFAGMVTSLHKEESIRHQNLETRTLRAINEFSYKYTSRIFPLNAFEIDPMVFRRIERKLPDRFEGLYRVCEGFASSIQLTCYGLAFGGHLGCAPLGRDGHALKVFPSSYYSNCILRSLTYMEKKYGNPKNQQ